MAFSLYERLQKKFGQTKWIRLCTVKSRSKARRTYNEIASKRSGKWEYKIVPIDEHPNEGEDHYTGGPKNDSIKK